ncbi:MAG: redoxin domain-containing protein [Pseudomonadota bacterium]
MNEPAEQIMLREGEVAPSFSLPAVSREGTISLDQYRGNAALLMCMLRGVYCPFCRRQIAQLSELARRIQTKGLETLLVITTPIDRARVYFKHYPTTMAIASDPEMTTHRAYGVPRAEVTEGETAWPKALNPADAEVVHADHAWRDVNEATSLAGAVLFLDSKDGYQRTDTEQDEWEATWNQLCGLALIDQAGIVRWTNVEARYGITDFGNIASASEIISAANGLVL